MDSRPRVSLQAGAAAFAAAFATLAAQILFHRVISAKLLNNYAFLVISLTMLGFAVSGGILTRRMRSWAGRLDEMMITWAALFVITTLGACMIFYRAPVFSEKFSYPGEFVRVLLKTLPYAFLFAVPFVFSGLILGMLLASRDLPTRKIYCWDLIGSALGAVAVLPAITFWGVEKSILAVSGFLLASVNLTARPLRKAAYWYSIAAAAVLALGFAFTPGIFKFHYQEGTLLWLTERPNSSWSLEFTRWDPVARIELSRITPPSPDSTPFAATFGGDPAFLKRFKRVLTQNNFAYTYAVDYDGNPASLEGIQETIYSAAYIAKSVIHPKVAVIGVGGGFDVLTALHFEASKITGIEVNGATLEILLRDFADYFHSWTQDPRVTLVHDDGRHYLRSTARTFDVIELSGVDSYSGTATAANVFSESYLYTQEAFGLYFSRLSPDGILDVMRLEHIPPREMFRVLTTAIAALRAAGVSDPSSHIVMLSEKDHHIAALLLKKSPFTNQEVQRLAQWTATNRFIEIVAAPNWNPGESSYQKYLGLRDQAAEERYWDFVPYNIAPATDDRPFFFNFSRWSHLPFVIRFSRWAQWPALENTIPRMEITLVVMFCLVSIAAWLLVWLPLRSVAVSLSGPAPRRYGLIFAGTALGYLAIEIALLQKFGLFLGHPNYALSVVLPGLLAATGVGSLMSRVICKWLGGPRYVGYTLAFMMIGICALGFPMLNLLAASAIWIRVLLALALITPLGALMGTFVPTAVEQLKSSSPGYVPWAWGINGIFSVLAPILSIGLSMTYGLNILFLSAVPIYVVTGWLYPRSSID